MQKFNPIKQYTDSICSQIRWKKAHNVISEEIENHILDQKDAFISQGLDEDTATEKAIKEMGDAITIGSQLDRTHRPKTEWSMIILTIFMLSIGFVINFIIASSISGELEFFYFYRSIFIAVLGIICMIIAYFIDFTIIGKYPKIIFASIIICMFIFLMYSTRVNGASVFLVPFSINFGVYSMSPSISPMLLTLLLPTCYAGIIYSMRNKGYLGIILCGVFYVVAAVCSMLISGNLTGFFIYTIVCFVLLLMSICKGWFNIKILDGILLVIIPTLLVLATIVFSFVRSQSFRLSRFHAWIDPSIDPLGAGYIPTVLNDILSGVNFIGRGTLPSQYTNNIFEVLPINTDYWLVYLMHRFGWITLVAVVMILLVFLVRGFYLSFKQKNLLGQLVSISVLLSLTLQMLMDILNNLALPSFRAASFPFMAYGDSGESILVNLVLVGVMLSVFRTGDLVRDHKSLRIKNIRNNKFLQVVDGKIIIDFGLK